MTGRVTNVAARAVFDSNGAPTIEVVVELERGISARAFAPRGSTTGEFEATVLENRQAFPALAAVEPAIRMVEDRIRPALLGQDGTNQAAIDTLLCDLDTEPLKRSIGGNVCVAVSTAVAQAGSRARGVPLHTHLAESLCAVLPTPMFNVIDGTPSPACAIAGIEFLLIPAQNVQPVAAMEMGVRVRLAVRELFWKAGRAAGDSPQGAISARLASCEEGLELMCQAAAACGYEATRDYTLGLDLAAADYVTGTTYNYAWCTDEERADWTQLLARYLRWTRQYPVRYLEDAFGERHTDAWERLLAKVDRDVMVPGDDLFASSAARITQGATAHWANAVLVKPNQVGTLSEAMAAMRVAREHGLAVIVSQRSGETDDAVLTHLAVSGQARYLKAGGMARLDRIVKYNELIRIGETLPLLAAS